MWRNIENEHLFANYHESDRRESGKLFLWFGSFSQ